MTQFDRERERIGRQLESGFMTKAEHARFSRAIASAEARFERRAERIAKRQEQIRRWKQRQKLTLQLVQSL